MSNKFRSYVEDLIAYKHIKFLEEYYVKNRSKDKEFEEMKAMCGRFQE